MSTPDDLPLENRSGNLYDPFFANRIEAVGRGAGRSPPPLRPRNSKGNGGGWGGFLAVVVIVGFLRACNSPSSSDRSRSRDIHIPRHRNFEVDTEEMRRGLDRIDFNEGAAIREFERMNEQLRQGVQPDGQRKPQGREPGPEAPDRVP